MRSPSYDETYWKCCDFLIEAGEVARKEFLENVNKRINKPDLMTEHNLRNASLMFSVDFSNDLYKLGDGYVYAYITNNGELFYIGCGQSDRVCNIHNRSESFKAIYKLGACPYVLASRVHKTCAEDIETLCIWVAQMNGCMLENSSKALSNFELRCFLAKQKGSEIEFNSDIENKWFKYENLMFEYKEVTEMLQHLFTICLDKTRFSQVIPNQYHGNPPPQVFVINGVTKTIKEWCDLYNVPRSRVYKYMKVYGLTPFQALTFPKIPNDNRKSDAIGYWRSLGLLSEEYTA